MSDESPREDTLLPDECFELPRNVCRQVRESADDHCVDEDKQCPFLWLCVSQFEEQDDGSKRLTSEEWLNVIDETASVGVCCVVMRLDGPFAAHPEMLEICKWAEDTHGMNVGLHLADGTLNDEDAALIQQLDPERTCLLLPENLMNDVKREQFDGMGLCCAEISCEEQHPPCDLPYKMLCVSPDGELYACALVIGDKRFSMGHVLEQPLGELLEGSLPRAIPADVHHPKGACDACPPIMARRLHDRMGELEFGEA